MLCWRTVFAECFLWKSFFQKINQPVDHEPVGLKENELHHEIQRGRISLETNFEGINTVIWNEPYSVTTRLSLEWGG